MSEIVSYQARIKTDDYNMPNWKSAFLDVRTDLVGSLALCVRFYPEWHYVCIIRDAEKPAYAALVTIPNPNLEEELLGHAHEKLGGKWEVVQRFYEQGKAGEI